MSIETIAWVLNHAPTETTSQQMVLLALANHCDPEGRDAFPSVQRIADYSRMSERAVQYNLRALEGLGIISRQADSERRDSYIKRADKRPNGYQINMRSGVQEMRPAKSDGVQPAPDGVQLNVERGAPDAPEPSIEPSVVETSVLLLDQSSASSGTLVRVDSIDGEFADWYAVYPRHVGRGQAVKAYRAARKKVSANVLLGAIRQQSAFLAAKGSEFCPHPATWLNGERWADEAPRQVATKSKYQQETDAVFNRAAQHLALGGPQ